jgi:hypothetical protein
MVNRVTQNGDNIMNDQIVFSDKNEQTYMQFLKVAIVLFVCGMAGLFVPMCGVPLILIILLLLSASITQMKVLIKIAIVLFVCGALGALTVRKTPLWPIILFFPYIAAPLLAIIASFIQSFNKFTSNRATHLFLLVFIFGFFLINLRTYVIVASPYAYMPSALTNENLSVYRECIKYVKNHEELKYIEYYMGLVKPSEPKANKSIMETTRQISNEPETVTIIRQLKQIMCPRFERRDSTIIFYKGSNPFIPKTTEELWHIWPSGHGVAYSLNGQNPNQSDDPILEKYKPFIRIHGNWYLSRGLLMTGNGRTYHSIPAISETLFDRSLYVDGIDPNELEKLN